jgi:hypothetical protein
MTPHLVRWKSTYGPRGFEAVYVDDGRRDAVAALEAAMAREGWNFAAVHDPGGRATQAYGVSAFPTAWVLDREGRVVWQGVPLRDKAAIERAIESAL